MNAIELYTDYLVQNNVENTQQGQHFLRVVEQVSKNRNLDTEKALRFGYCRRWGVKVLPLHLSTKV